MQRELLYRCRRTVRPRLALLQFVMTNVTFYYECYDELRAQVGTITNVTNTYECYVPFFPFTNVMFSRTAGTHYECYVLAPLIYVIFGYLQMLRYKPEELQMLRLS